MGRALVLNASYEPLCVVPARRAVVLVLSEKADLVHDSGEVVHSERMSVAVPSVIRLRYYVRVPFQRNTALSRRAVFHRDDFTCQYCGSAAESIDHVVPRSRGGAHEWTNVVAACRRCNAGKGDRMLAETSMVLPRRPVAPRELSWVIVAVPEVPDHWQPYLEPARLMPA
ncbi:MAG: HNH endonuclease [Acidimicrobiia bacterium]|nr:HNH endonuclease [Acidimicrobiia bacterium]